MIEGEFVAYDDADRHRYRVRQILDGVVIVNTNDDIILRLTHQQATVLYHQLGDMSEKELPAEQQDMVVRLRETGISEAEAYFMVTDMVDRAINRHGE